METKTRYDYLIIGGGVAGTSAAETLRQRDPKAGIAIVSDEPYPFYSRIMLSKPNFFLKKIPFDNVWLKKEKWYKENNITLLTGRGAVSFDVKTATVKLEGGDELQYGKLLLAIGASANEWKVPGAEKPGVLCLRGLDDAKKIMAAVKTSKRAVCVGSGFTSFEMCDMLRLANVEVALVMLEPHYWYPLLDWSSGRLIEQALEKSGVKIFRQAEIIEVTGGQSVEGAILKDGTRLACDLIIPGIGVHPPLQWLTTSGIKTNRGIIANEYLETSLSNIWTAGDCAEFKDLVLDEQILLGNWANAQAQGRVAGANMAGQKKPFRMVSFYAAQGSGITLAFAGDVRPQPDRQIIARGAEAAGSYGRIFVKNDRIVGATLINRTQELAALSRLIEQGAAVLVYAAELADPNFDLKKILPPPSSGETGDAAAAPRSFPDRIRNRPTPAGREKNPAVGERGTKKIRVGWFSFSCCEDSTIVFTELLNDHWQEWKDLFDFRHARVLKSKNVLDELDIAFVEGAIASEEHEARVKEIRAKSKKLVAVGACAVQGMPSGQRNLFSEEQKREIEFLLARFRAAKKVQKVSDVVKVDATIPGCPMDPKTFLDVTGRLVKELAAAG